MGINQRAWTLEEIDILKRCVDSAMTYTEIANILNRTSTGVSSYARRLGLQKERNYTCPIEFTDRERQIVYGTLFGDASIHKHPNANSCYLEIYHKYDHMEYLNWFVSELSRFNASVFSWTVYSESHNRIVTKCNLRTSASTPLWCQLREEFYEGEHHKIYLPVEQLTPLALAVMWQDDGSYNYGYKSGVLSCQGFPSEERDKLRDFIKSEYGVMGVFTTNGEIRFNKDDMAMFIDIIRPHIIDMFKYKLGDVVLPKVRQCATFEFDASHFLEDYDGGCINMHGHRYKVEVILNTYINPDTGMGWDYKDIKRVVNPIVDVLDHNMLNSVCDMLKWRSTTELISVYLWTKLIDQLPLFEIKIYETPSTWCSYRGGK